MMTLTNANPDFYRTTVREYNGDKADRTVIYSTLDQLVIGQTTGLAQQLENIPSTTDVTVYALDLTIVGSIVVPGADVRIYCRTLRISEAGATIDVSAPPLDPRDATSFTPPAVTVPATPPRGGRHGADIMAAIAAGQGGEFGVTDPAAVYHCGERGLPAGQLTVLCDELVMDGPLLLKANGGNGYPGCDGQRGGPSATVTVTAGRGGDGQRGGDGRDGGTIMVRYRTALRDLEPRCEVMGGDGGASGRPGAGGPPDGVAGSCPSLSAVGGGLGSATVAAGLAPRTFGEAVDEVFLLKLVQKVRYLYLRNQPTKYFADQEPEYPPGWTRLGKLLKWLRETLVGYVGPGKGDAPVAEQRKRDLYAITAKLATQHTNGYTYFGWEPDWVPNLPIDAMLSTYEHVKATRAATEAAFLRMSGELDTREKQQQARDDSRIALTATRDAYRRGYLQTIGELTEDGTCMRSVDLALTRFGEASAALRAVIDDRLRPKIEGHFDCNTENLFKGLEMMAFTASDPKGAVLMGGVQTAEFVYNGFTNVTDNSGRAVKKDYLYQEITSATGVLSAAARDELFEKGEDGKFRATEKQKLLVTTVDKFDGEISGLSGQLGSSLTEAVSEAIAELRGAIDEKGRAQLQYYSYATLAAEQYTKFEDAKRRLDELDAEPEPIDPYWASLAAHHAMLYQDQLDETARSVALLQRKLSYVTLDPRSRLNVATLSESLWVDGTPPTPQTMTDMDVQVESMRGQLNDYESTSSSPYTSYPADEDMRGNLTVHVKDRQVIERFVRDRSLIIETVPAKSMAGLRDPKVQPTALRCEVSDSGNYYDIRVTTIRPRVIGAATKSGSLVVTARLATRSSIANSKGQLLTFAHQFPRQTQFVHDTDTAPTGRTNDDMGQGDAGVLTDNYLDAVGLYGVWTIAVPDGADEDTNAGLDLSGVTSIKIYFSGFARPRAARNHLGR